VRGDRPSPRIVPAHAIAPAQPGTAYVVDDDGTVDRVRAHCWTDDVVRTVAQLYPAPDLGELSDPSQDAGTLAAPESAGSAEVIDDVAGVPGAPTPASKPRASRKPWAPRAPRVDHEPAS
jgi:S-DNA-T family DNA segregation ATPase FtsK/SpoIIIE